MGGEQITDLGCGFVQFMDPHKGDLLNKTFPTVNHGSVCGVGSSDFPGSLCFM